MYASFHSMHHMHALICLHLYTCASFFSRIMSCSLLLSLSAFRLTIYIYCSVIPSLCYNTKKMIHKLRVCLVRLQSQCNIFTCWLAFQLTCSNHHTSRYLGACELLYSAFTFPLSLSLSSSLLLVSVDQYFFCKLLFDHFDFILAQQFNNSTIHQRHQNNNIRMLQTTQSISTETNQFINHL